MKNFLRILRYARKYWVFAVLNIVFNILSIVFSVFSIIMVIPFMRLLFGMVDLVKVNPGFKLSVEGMLNYLNYEFSRIIQSNGPEEALIYICIAVSVVFFAKNLTRYLAMYFITPLRSGVVKDIRNDMYRKILVLPVGYFSEERKGDIMSRMTSDVLEIDWSILNFIESIFRDPITIIAYLFCMLYLSPQLTLFVLILLPIAALIIGQLGKTLKRSSQKGQNKLGFILSLIEETLSGQRIVKGFNAGKYLGNRFDKEVTDYEHLANGMLRRRDLSSPLSEFLAVTVVAVVLWFGGKLVIANHGGLGPAAFIGFILAFAQIINPAKSFSTSFYNIQKGMASAERILKILDAENTIIELPDAKSVSSFNNSIEYKSIVFAYQKEPVLKDVSVKIEKGQTIAIVGPSGAGKSTFVDLLPRFYDPIGGEILLDDINTKNLKLHDLRQLMGIVTQEPILFNDTVFNNIAFGMPNATKDDVIAAAKVANAHDYVIKMEHGYDTIIGDRGSKLSGGERQRLTIARAVFKNPPILILDEATSSLDTESEKLVQDALYNLMKNRTSIVIAHRLSTIQNADFILVLQNGKIVEQGNHLQLLAKNGLYTKLVELQQF